jgi:hypothetical protein
MVNSTLSVECQQAASTSICEGVAISRLSEILDAPVEVHCAPCGHSNIYSGRFVEEFSRQL